MTNLLILKNYIEDLKQSNIKYTNYIKENFMGGKAKKDYEKSFDGLFEIIEDLHINTKKLINHTNYTIALNDFGLDFLIEEFYEIKNLLEVVKEKLNEQKSTTFFHLMNLQKKIEDLCIKVENKIIKLKQ